MMWLIVKEKHFFSVFINYTQLTLIQPRLNPGIKKIHGIRDQVLQQFWDQGSKFKAQMWDQSAKNIPWYDPEVFIEREQWNWANLPSTLPHTPSPPSCFSPTWNPLPSSLLNDCLTGYRYKINQPWKPGWPALKIYWLMLCFLINSPRFLKPLVWNRSLQRESIPFNIVQSTPDNSKLQGK